MKPKTLSLLLLSFSIIFLPFWVTIIIFIISIFSFDRFYWPVFLMFLWDALYKFEFFNPFGFPGFIFLSSVLVYVVIELLKRYVLIRKV